MSIATRGLSYPRAVEPELEPHFLQRVLRLAQLLGWQLRYHTYRSDRSASGFPDLVLVRPPRCLFVELKTDAAPQRLPLEQEAWKDALERCPGVEYRLWRPRDWATIERELARRTR